MDQKIIILIIIAALIIGGYFILTRQEGSLPFLGNELRQEGAPAASEQGFVAARQIMVTGADFKFEPSEITARPGERLRIIFVNAGMAPHNLAIEGLDVTTQTIGPGQQSAVEFTVPAEGEYPMTVFCSVPGHREQGMVGTLIVE